MTDRSPNTRVSISMSMDHKAFAFDWDAFESELLPVLTQALETSDTAALKAFIDEHRESLVDPVSEDLLAEDWQDTLVSGDVQELADLALTKYYEPTEDCGLGEWWDEINKSLAPAAGAALLGTPLKGGAQVFDPGRMGAYFQSPTQTGASAKALGSVSMPDVEEYRDFLKGCAEDGMGVYVTF